MKYLYYLGLCINLLGILGGCKPLMYKTVKANFNRNAGVILPDVKMDDTSGNTTYLSEWEGEVFFVTLWGTWCRPCIKDIPDANLMVSRLRDYTSISIVHIGVLCDQEDWIQMIRVKGFKGKHYFLENEEFEKLNQVIRVKKSGFPYNFILSSDQTVMGTGMGSSQDEQMLTIYMLMKGRYGKYSGDAAVTLLKTVDKMNKGKRGDDVLELTAYFRQFDFLIE